MVMYVLLRLLAVILLVAGNAFFVAAEYALVSVRDTRIEQLIAARRIGARTVQKLHQKLDEVLNGVQLGVTMASLALFSTFPTYINYIGQTKANPAAALTIISFGITWLALLGILLVGRRPGRTAVQVGGTH